MRFIVYFSSVGEFSDPILLAELAHEAEEVGWDGVFIWDHISQPTAAADPWVALSAMAMKTEQIVLGPIVTPIARRRPWKLARETVTLDRLSNGRLILGVGLGWSPKEFEDFGEVSDSSIRAEKLDEGLAVLDGLWRGEDFSYSGKQYQLKNVRFTPRPVQSPRIPIWACGTWPGSKAPFRRAAHWDGIIAILSPGYNRAIRPEEVSAVRSYIKQHRDSDDPFDIIVILWSEGARTAEEQDEVKRYSAGGVTWWLEDMSTERFSSVQEVKSRLGKGPPGVCHGSFLS